MAESEEFQKLQRRIDAYVRQKSEKFASLKESDFLARRAEFDADKEEEDQVNKQEKRRIRSTMKRSTTKKFLDHHGLR